MRALRGVFAFAAVSFLLLQAEKLIAGSKSPLGALTQAIAAHLNEAAAFPGLSFFEGETLSTESSGRMTARVGGSILTLGGTARCRCIGSSMGLMRIWMPGASIFQREKAWRWKFMRWGRS